MARDTATDAMLLSSIVRVFLTFVTILSSTCFLQAFPLTRATKVLSYTYDNGHWEQDVVQLHGSVLMTYKKKNYRLPAMIILPHAFPRVAPLVYMNPKPGMVRNARSPYVNGSLQVLSEYINRWEYPFSSLEQLYLEMQEAFGKSPPLRQLPGREVGGAQQGAAHAGGSHAVPSPRPSQHLSQAVSSHRIHHGDDRRREELIESLRRLVNESLDLEYGCLASSVESEVDRGAAWDNKLEVLSEEVKAYEGRVSDMEMETNALVVWLEEAEAKIQKCRVPGGIMRGGRKFLNGLTRGSSVHDIDAYEAAAPMTGPAREALEAGACVRAVQDAVRELDAALADRRIAWKEYKRMFSQLMAIKFQAKIVQREAAKASPTAGTPQGLGEALDCSSWTYPEVEDGIEDGFNDDKTPVSDIDTRDDTNVLGENPLRRGRYRDLVSSDLSFRSVP